jgi:hypothetical protein
VATFVLVHGGWHGGWCWRAVAPLLRQAGHTVHAPTLTGLGEHAHLLASGVDLDLHARDRAAGPPGLPLPAAEFRVLIHPRLATGVVAHRRTRPTRVLATAMPPQSQAKTILPVVAESANRKAAGASLSGKRWVMMRSRGTWRRCTKEMISGSIRCG